jgi:fimbrial chaperone protein
MNRVFMFAMMYTMVTVVAPVLSYAGKFSVSPVIATLGESKKIDSLALKNESDQPVTIQVKLNEWHQNEEGKDTLTPSDALSYMPRIFQLKPGEERSVRIGFSAKKAPQIEQAYRLYLVEQPQATLDPNEKGQLKVALSMGVPVFVSPKEPVRDKGTMENSSVSKGKVVYSVTNAGNSRLVMKAVTITGFDIAGKELFSKDVGRQYVMAAKKRNFSVPLLPEECAKAAIIGIVGELETGGSLKASVHTPAGACKE